jgi:hypothetical protein
MEHTICSLVSSDDVALRVDVDSVREDRAGKIDCGETSPAEEIAVKCSIRILIGTDDVSTRINAVGLCDESPGTSIVWKPSLFSR